MMLFSFSISLHLPFTSHPPHLTQNTHTRTHTHFIVVCRRKLFVARLFTTNNINTSCKLKQQQQQQ